MSYLMLFFILIVGCEEGRNTQDEHLKVLSKECVNICPNGVKTFKISYGKSECECRP